VTDELKGRVALLTGASGGIGKAIARRLADEGADLCLAYGRLADDAESVAEYARELGRRVARVAADMSDPNAPAALVAHANDELGEVDLLIANACTADVKGWQEIDLACISSRRGSPPRVTINCLAPALVGATKMFPADLDTGTPPIPIPVGRVGRPDEMADMAIAMLRNGYLTNKVITLDGGIAPRNSD
jgi:3-oxoacyl-[acyl-carrier protein] reductase